ncbi:conserved protein [Tepidicaulis marinus]|jgi:DUF971 family protein|uniref:Conserved protein n=1 Tax=Tepidicaulis marinus TaxID=1333998 RepID=A0A081B6J6_9HYPH|nr:DUF971 domain-containing protein [Tepidicaulis marinus]GAK43664.1 conserved protein [Tepidicaulis marinus]
MSEGRPWPTDVNLNKGEQVLEIAFDDGAQFHLPAEYLRVESPSAEVQGHGGDEKKIVPGKEHVRIEALESVGNYALRLIFDDGHDSGLYTWDYLYELGANQNEKWQTYLAELAKRGLNR